LVFRRNARTGFSARLSLVKTLLLQGCFNLIKNHFASLAVLTATGDSSTISSVGEAVLVLLTVVETFFFELVVVLIFPFLGAIQLYKCVYASPTKIAGEA
jgi:hypothetical protein